MAPVKPMPHWKQRETSALLNTLKRHTRFVRFSKRFLLLIAAGLIIVVVGLPLLEQDESGVRIMFSGMKKQVEELPPTMVQPRFEGMDQNSQPYTVTADSAVQRDNDTVLLSNLKADITLEDSTWLAVSAKNGVLHMEAKKMELTGNVQMVYGDGYEMRGDKVMVDMQSKSARSESEVQGQGPMGALKAGGFEVTAGGEVMRFTQPVRMVIYPKGNI